MHSGAMKPHPEGKASVAVTGGADGSDVDAPKETPTSVGLPAVDFGAAGPLFVREYPATLTLGSQDFATLVGYSKDGSEAIACGLMTPLGPAKGAELADTCFFTGPSGKTERLLGVTDDNIGGFRVTDAFAKKLKALQDGKPITLYTRSQGTELQPPALKTSWPYANDLALMVSKVGGNDDTGRSTLRIGGLVKGEKVPVLPVAVRIEAPIAGAPYDGEWNAIVPNPENTELAFMAHFRCMEWCNDMVIVRLTYGKIASLVFNDTGFQHHKKKEFAASRDLFLKATWANPRAPLPPYNLACAYALLKDEANAAKALKLAIAVAGDTVKARAKKDTDFHEVLGAKWFQDLTK